MAKPSHREYSSGESHAGMLINLEWYHKEPSASFRKFFDIRRRIASASGSSHNGLPSAKKGPLFSPFNPCSCRTRVERGEKEGSLHRVAACVSYRTLKRSGVLLWGNFQNDALGSYRRLKGNGL